MLTEQKFYVHLAEVDRVKRQDIVEEYQQGGFKNFLNSLSLF
jgi:hypothetical protein